MCVIVCVVGCVCVYACVRVCVCARVRAYVYACMRVRVRVRGGVCAPGEQDLNPCVCEGGLCWALAHLQVGVLAPSRDNREVHQLASG